MIVLSKNSGLVYHILIKNARRKRKRSEENVVFEKYVCAIMSPYCIQKGEIITRRKLNMSETETSEQEIQQRQCRLYRLPCLRQ